MYLSVSSSKRTTWFLRNCLLTTSLLTSLAFSGPREVKNGTRARKLYASDLFRTDTVPIHPAYMHALSLRFGEGPPAGNVKIETSGLKAEGALRPLPFIGCFLLIDNSASTCGVLQHVSSRVVVDLVEHRYEVGHGRLGRGGVTQYAVGSGDYGLYRLEEVGRNVAGIDGAVKTTAPRKLLYVQLRPEELGCQHLLPVTRCVGQEENVVRLLSGINYISISRCVGGHRCRTVAAAEHDSQGPYAVVDRVFLGRAKARVLFPVPDGQACGAVADIAEILAGNSRKGRRKVYYIARGQRGRLPCAAGGFQGEDLGDRVVAGGGDGVERISAAAARKRGSHQRPGGIGGYVAANGGCACVVPFIEIDLPAINPRFSARRGAAAGVDGHAGVL